VVRLYLWSAAAVAHATSAATAATLYVGSSFTALHKIVLPSSGGDAGLHRPGAAPGCLVSHALGVRKITVELIGASLRNHRPRHEHLLGLYLDRRLPQLSVRRRRAVSVATRPGRGKVIGFVEIPRRPVAIACLAPSSASSVCVRQSDDGNVLGFGELLFLDGRAPSPAVNTGLFEVHQIISGCSAAPPQHPLLFRSGGLEKPRNSQASFESLLRAYRLVLLSSI